MFSPPETHIYFKILGILFLIAVLSLSSSIIFQIHAGNAPTAYQIFDISFYHFVPFLLWTLYLPFVNHLSHLSPLKSNRDWIRHLMIALLFAFISRILAIWLDFAIKYMVGMTEATPLSILWDVRWVVLASVPKEFLMYWLVFFLVRYFERPAPQKEIEKLILDTDQGTVLLAPETLLYIESSRNYIIVHSTQGKFKSRKTLKSIISQLDEQFVQIHRSRVVNKDAVFRIISWRNGEYMLELTNGLHVSSSRSFHANVKTIGCKDTIRPALV